MMYSINKMLEYVDCTVDEYYTEFDEGFEEHFNYDGDKYVAYVLDNKGNGDFVSYGYTLATLQDEVISKLIDTVKEMQVKLEDK